MGDILTISQLAVRVVTAYKDAPDDYRHISEEVEAFQVLIDGVEQYLKCTAISSDDLQKSQKVLKSCQSVLEDLNSLIEKYKSLASTNRSLVFQRVKLGTEDIVTLRLRLISNTGLLNGFFQRFDISTITSFAGSINTKKAYKEFCQNLHQNGVTAEMIGQKKKRNSQYI